MGSAILLESGDTTLLEDGSALLTEAPVAAATPAAPRAHRREPITEPFQVQPPPLKVRRYRTDRERVLHLVIESHDEARPAPVRCDRGYQWRTSRHTEIRAATRSRAHHLHTERDHHHVRGREAQDWIAMRNAVEEEVIAAVIAARHR